MIIILIMITAPMSILIKYIGPTSITLEGVFLILFDFCLVFAGFPIILFTFKIHKLFFRFIKTYYNLMSAWGKIKGSIPKPFVVNKQKKMLHRNLKDFGIYVFGELAVIYLVVMPITFTLSQKIKNVEELLFLNLVSIIVVLAPFFMLVTAKILNIERNGEEISPSIFHKLWSLILLIILFQKLLTLDWPSSSIILFDILLVILVLFGFSFGFVLIVEHIGNQMYNLADNEQNNSYLTVIPEYE